MALAVNLMPLPDGLTEAGQRTLAILAFAIIVWLTEALDYAVSSVLIVALLALVAIALFLSVAMTATGSTGASPAGH